MSTWKQHSALALLLCLAIAACSSNRGYDSGNSGSTGGDASSTPQTASYGTVQTIEPGTRQEIGVGTLGGAAAGGTVGAPADQVYRVTVRMDDGSTQSVVLDSMPAGYRVGDRVRYSNGSLQRSQ